MQDNFACSYKLLQEQVSQVKMSPQKGWADGNFW